MKFSAAILLPIMLALTTLPLTRIVFASTDNCKHSACVDMCASKQKQEPQKESPCSNGLCNPFLSCSFSVYLTMENYSLAEVSLLTSEQLNGFKNNNYICSYYSKCWHPPEAV